MVCTADDILEWKDFPKGLRVLLLSEDSSSAAEIRSKLEDMDYIVHTFCNEDEALSAISNKPESFHLAIVEVSTSNSQGSFKFLETAKDIPTIMTSNIHCLRTMMKCIALGAVEFLRKPLSEDKLRNIWQHVVHKAFNAGNRDIPESLMPVQESVASMLQLEHGNEDPKKLVEKETEIVPQEHENDFEQTTGNDKYPAPSTPQLKQTSRLFDEGDCQDQMNYCTEKESEDMDGKFKSVETTCEDSVPEATIAMSQSPRSGESTVKQEEDAANGCKSEGDLSSQLKNGSGLSLSDASNYSHCKAAGIQDSGAYKANRKKMKVDWTPELHKKFVQAVEQLGVDQAIPSRILELMKVEGLTRHNVASHLQKYRMHRRNILPKDEERRWSQSRDSMQRSYYPPKPIMAFPPYHANPSFPTNPVYPAWGAPNYHPANVPLWPPPSYIPWHPTHNWQWKPYPGMHADAWGCPVPVMAPPHGSCSFPQSTHGFQSTSPVDNFCDTHQNSFDFHPAEEVIDKLVKEAISKPWLPLPLGLKLPSTESVLAELSRAHQQQPHLPLM